MRGELASPMLQRAAQQLGKPREPEVQRCELCAERIDTEHQHVFELSSGELQCACRACSVLFDHNAAGGRDYRLVPRRRTKLTDMHLDPPLWASLGVPVDLAFFVRDSATSEVVARYPSAAGTLRSTVPEDSWQRLAQANPRLHHQDTDVEALVINRSRDSSDYWLLPLDDCYRLTALLRENWSGFTGGERVWEEISRFFAELKEVR